MGNFASLERKYWSEVGENLKMAIKHLHIILIKSDTLYLHSQLLKKWQDEHLTSFVIIIAFSLKNLC